MRGSNRFNTNYGVHIAVCGGTSKKVHIGAWYAFPRVWGTFWGTKNQQPRFHGAAGGEERRGVVVEEAFAVSLQHHLRASSCCVCRGMKKVPEAGFQVSREIFASPNNQRPRFHGAASGERRGEERSEMRWQAN